MKLTRREFAIVASGTMASPFGHIGAASAAQHSDGLISLSASTLARQIREKKVSSVEMVSAYPHRIKQVERRLNAVIYLSETTALVRAKEADHALAGGENWGPLHGVPVTIKDSLEIIGIPTTHGAPRLKNYVPKRDATVVSRLKAAGAIILAKTNLPFLSLWSETDNLLHDATNNPYDLERTPGGSSGGEAALISSSASALAIGTDIGGSIRTPSHWCGIVGLCPSLCRVPVSGIYPPIHDLQKSIYTPLGLECDFWLCVIEAVDCWRGILFGLEDSKANRAHGVAE